jgi:hypothetical protein
MSARRGGPTVRRLPALVAVLALVAGIVAASRAGHEFTPAVRAAPVPAAGPTVPAADAITSTWFCAEGTSSTGGRADETVIVANLARRAVTATVTVQPGTGLAAASRQVRVEALGQRRVDVSSVLVTPEPGVVVEVVGGAVVVEHELRRSSQSTVGPCARQAAPDWYFAAGDTGLGTEDWLALFNPFPDDAIVDLTFLTAEGIQAPGTAQAVVVPRHSRLSFPVSTVVRDQTNLAFHVHARVGRVIAEQSLYFDGTNGPAGLATALGATAPSPGWRIPTGDAQSGASATLAVANFANVGTRVQVVLTLDNNTTVAPIPVTVPSMGIADVNLSQRVAAGTGYAINVRAPAGSPVVVELLQSWAPPASVTGRATTFGATTVAKRWAFALGRVDNTGDAQLVAVNVSGKPISVELLAYTAGDPNSPRSAPAQAVSPGKRAVFPLAANGVGTDQVVVLQSDGAIVAGRLDLGVSPSMTIGLPELP